MTNQQPPRPAPTELPVPIPQSLPRTILARGRLLLCLDFDGTLSEIVPHPAHARPVSGVPESIAALARHPKRLAVAVVSGREISEVRAMLGESRGVMFSGTHGLEIAGPDGRIHAVAGTEASMGDIGKVREWLSTHVARRKGFVIEDKGYALTMHYRMAEPAQASQLREALKAFVEATTPSLWIMNGNKVDEVLPRGIGGKGRAVRTLMKELGEPEPFPVYIGDDTTDEDAFYEIRNDGLGILVGPMRPTWARYRLDGPSDVARLLAQLASEAGRIG